MDEIVIDAWGCEIVDRVFESRPDRPRDLCRLAVRSVVGWERCGVHQHKLIDEWVRRDARVRAANAGVGPGRDGVGADGLRVSAALSWRFIVVVAALYVIVWLAGYFSAACRMPGRGRIPQLDSTCHKIG